MHARIRAAPNQCGTEKPHSPTRILCYKLANGKVVQFPHLKACSTKYAQQFAGSISFYLLMFYFHLSLSTFHLSLCTLEMKTQASRIHRQGQSQHFIPRKCTVSFVLPTFLKVFRKPFLFQQPFLLRWAPHGNNAEMQLRTLHFTKVFQHVLMETRSSAQDLHGARAVNRNRSLLGNCDFASFSIVLKDSEEPFLLWKPLLLPCSGIHDFASIPIAF